MNKAAKKDKMDRIDDGSWLKQSLAGDAKNVAKHPTPEAIGRMRGRLMAQLKRPTKAAA